MRKKPLLYAFIGVYVLLKLVLLVKHHDVRWDEAVFLSMAKHVLSAGASGYWEALRPPLYPLILSALDVLGDPVLLGELLNTGLALLSAWLLYDLLREEIDRTYAAYAGLTLLFADVWFWYSSMLFTGVPAATLLVLACWLYAKDRPVLAGLASAAAFLTRFPAGLVLPAVLGGYAYAYYAKRTKNPLVDAAKYAAAFAAPIAAWMAINGFLWSAQAGWLSATIHPLVQGGTNALTQNLWTRDTDVLFYARRITQSIPLLLLALPGAYWLRRHARLVPLALTGILAAGFFTVILNNQWRFAILFIPGLLVLAFIAVEQLREHTPRIATALVLLHLVLLAGGALLLTNDRAHHPLPQEDAYRFLQEHPVNGTVVTTDPVAAHYIDNPVVPAYYEFRKSSTQGAAAVFLVPQHLPCPPADAACEQETERIIQELLDEHALVYEQHTGGYSYYVLSNHVPVAPLDETALRERYNLSSS